MLNSIVGDL